jgi:hypothetical protein
MFSKVYDFFKEIINLDLKKAAHTPQPAAIGYASHRLFGRQVGHILESMKVKNGLDATR